MVGLGLVCNKNDRLVYTQTQESVVVVKKLKSQAGSFESL